MPHNAQTNGTDTVWMNRRLALCLGAALILGACSVTETAETDNEPISLGSSSSPEPPDDPTDPAPSESTDGSTEVLPEGVTPALGITGSSANTYDDRYLVEGVGSGFVVMDNPLMVEASAVTWLADTDIVMGVLHESGETHAYPIGQMAYHHIANTTIAGEPYLVTY